MTQGNDGAIGTDEGLRRFWDVHTLPCEEYRRDWDRILGYRHVKTMLRRYATLTKLLADHHIARRELDLSGLVLLKGLPGTGKSTIARGFADQFAATLGGHARLFVLRTQHVISEWLGRSAKEIAKAFDPVRFAAAQGPTVMLVNEVEAISIARKMTINSSDPSDLVRATDQLLQETDSLQQFPHTVVVGTSNFPEVIDDAFWSRADLVVDFQPPDTNARQAILQARHKNLMPLGLRLDRDDIAAIAKVTDGLSGRTLGKLFVQTYLTKEVGFEEMSVSDVLEALEESRQGQKEDNHAGS